MPYDYMVEVLYVPDIVYNFISFFRAPQYCSIKDDDKERNWVETSRNFTNAWGLWKGFVSRLQMVCMKIYVHYIRYRQTDLSILKNRNIWHKRLGHWSQDMINASVPQISKAGHSASSENGNECNLCGSGNFSRLPWNALFGETRAAVKAIEKIFLDVVGPMIEESSRKFKSFVTLIGRVERHSMARIFFFVKISLQSSHNGKNRNKEEFLPKFTQFHVWMAILWNGLGLMENASMLDMSFRTGYGNGVLYTQ